MPTISVVLPVYNGERFLAEAIESALAQTYCDFELIIIDDGSTDQCPEIIASYQHKDSRVVVQRHSQNLGITAALNKGCAAARGEFIAIMNQDDVCVSSRFRKQIEYLRLNPEVGLIGSYAQLIDECGRLGKIYHYPTQPGLAAWLLLFFCSLLHPTVMVRRALLASQGFYPLGCGGGTEDYAMFIRLSRFTRLTTLPEVLLLYRRWEGQVTHKQWGEQEAHAIRILQMSITDLLGFAITSNEAAALRGLSTDSYPSELDEISRLAQLIQALRHAYFARFRPTRSDVASIDLDCAIRILLLAALAVRHSPRMSLSLALSATQISAKSPFLFFAKVVRRLLFG